MSRFKVGQKVVCINDIPNTMLRLPIKKGVIYKVAGIVLSPCCGKESLQLEGVFKINNYPTSCSYCCNNYSEKIGALKLLASRRFAPIEEYTDSLSIAESLVKELSEVDKAKEPIKELA